MASAPTPTFPFGIEHLDLYHQNDDVRSLRSAAISGDIAVIDRVDQRFGGALYIYEIARQAIESKHLAFYERYLLLCRWHLISINLVPYEDDNKNFWRYYLDPIFDCMTTCADVEVRCKVVRIIVEKLLPSLPEYDEIVFCENRLLRRGAELRLPDHKDTIWALDDFHSIVNNRHGQRIMLTFCIPFQEKLFRYFTEEVGLTFDCRMLEYWSKRFNRRIYQFVLDHLDPSIDKSSLSAQCHYREEPPNDGDFFNIVQSFRPASQHECNVPYMAEFLHDHPQFIPKIPSLMRELQNAKPYDDPFEIEGAEPFAIMQAVDNPETIPFLLDFLQDVQNQIPMADHVVQFDIYCEPRARSYFE